MPIMTPKTLLVTTLVWLLACGACKKKDNETPPAAAITDGMAGVRNWHGNHYYDASGIHFPTPVHEFSYFPDTSFAVTIIDDTTIQAMGTTYMYQQTDSAKQIHFFGTAYFYYEYGMGTGVAYYYAKDSIVHCHGDRHGTSDQWTLRDLWYTY